MIVEIGTSKPEIIVKNNCALWPMTLVSMRGSRRWAILLTFSKSQPLISLSLRIIIFHLYIIYFFPGFDDLFTSLSTWLASLLFCCSMTCRCIIALWIWEGGTKLNMPLYSSSEAHLNILNKNTKFLHREENRMNANTCSASDLCFKIDLGNKET